jgi:hypothetical protein
MIQVTNKKKKELEELLIKLLDIMSVKSKNVKNLMALKAHLINISNLNINNLTMAIITFYIYNDLIIILFCTLSATIHRFSIILNHHNSITILTNHNISYFCPNRGIKSELMLNFINFNLNLNNI